MFCSYQRIAFKSSAGSFFLCALLVLGGCGGNSDYFTDPTALVQEYLRSIDRGEYDRAYECLSDSHQRQIPPDFFPIYVDGHSDMFRPASFVISSTDLRGEAAFVEVVTIDPKGGKTRVQYSLRKEPTGIWKIEEVHRLALPPG